MNEFDTQAEKALSIYACATEERRNNGEINNGESRRAFAKTVAASNMEKLFGGDWINKINDVTDSSLSASILFKGYVSTLDEAFATRRDRSKEWNRP